MTDACALHFMFCWSVWSVLGLHVRLSRVPVTLCCIPTARLFKHVSVHIRNTGGCSIHSKCVVTGGFVFVVEACLTGLQVLASLYACAAVCHVHVWLGAA